MVLIPSLSSDGETANGEGRRAGALRASRGLSAFPCASVRPTLGLMTAVPGPRRENGAPLRTPWAAHARALRCPGSILAGAEAAAGVGGRLIDVGAVDSEPRRARRGMSGSAWSGGQPMGAVPVGAGRGRR
jgi:hypothetical protein